MVPRLPYPIGHKTPEPARDQAADARPDWAPLFAQAELARCCSAWPTTVAVFAPRQGRSRPVDLLLCGHHYRASRASLAEAGAEFYCLPSS
jgi:hypothetical protein